MISRARLTDSSRLIFSKTCSFRLNIVTASARLMKPQSIAWKPIPWISGMKEKKYSAMPAMILEILQINSILPSVSLSFSIEVKGFTSRE